VVSKLINEPIKVHIGKNPVMTSSIWRRRLYKVIDVLSWWREPARWWNGELVRVLVRVIAANRSTGVYELCKIETNWFLHKLLD
jgi:hypothetical protein